MKTRRFIKHFVQYMFCVDNLEDIPELYKPCLAWEYRLCYICILLIDPDIVNTIVRNIWDIFSSKLLIEYPCAQKAVIISNESLHIYSNSITGLYLYLRESKTITLSLYNKIKEDLEQHGIKKYETTRKISCCTLSGVGSELSPSLFICTEAGNKKISLCQLCKNKLDMVYGACQPLSHIHCMFTLLMP